MKFLKAVLSTAYGYTDKDIDNILEKEPKRVKTLYDIAIIKLSEEAECVHTT